MSLNLCFGGFVLFFFILFFLYTGFSKASYNFLNVLIMIMNYCILVVHKSHIFRNMSRIYIYRFEFNKSIFFVALRV